MIAPLSFALSSLPVVFWRVLRYRPNVILCIEPTLFCAPAALLAGRLVGARTFLHVQDLEIDAAFAVRHLHGGVIKAVAFAIERHLLRAFDGIITISNRMAERLAEKGVSRDRVSIVRNWVDLDHVKPLADVSRYRAELGVPPNAFVALYAGNMGPKQSLPVVLEAAARLSDKSPALFVLVGEGPEKEKLREKYGHLKNVMFLPIQPEDKLCELLNLAGVHLLPQDSGAADLVLPSKLGGMLASGRPCIVMASPGTELHSFLDGVAHLLPPGDCEALAAEVEIVRLAGQVEHLPKVVAWAANFDAKKNLPIFGALLGLASQPSSYLQAE